MAASKLSIVTNAGIDALVADATLSGLLGGAKVYNHLPQNTAAPYVMGLGGEEAPWAEIFDETGDDGARQVDFEARIVSAYEGTKELDTIASRVLAVLTTPSTWSGLSGFSASVFLRHTRPTVIEWNGVLYFERWCVVRVFLYA